MYALQEGEIQNFKLRASGNEVLLIILDLWRVDCNKSVLPEIPVVEWVIADVSKDIIAFIFIVRQSRRIGLELFDQKELDFAFWLCDRRNYDLSKRREPIAQ